MKPPPVPTAAQLGERLHQQELEVATLRLAIDIQGSRIARMQPTLDVPHRRQSHLGRRFRPGMPRKVLIVDDDDLVRTFLETVLRRARYDVLTTDSVPDARRALEESAPDLLITDVRLGAYNGLQLIAMKAPSIPAIVMTGFVDPVIEADANRWGACVLAKPIVPTMLLALVNELLPAAQDNDSR